MLPAMGAQGNSGLVITERIEPGDSGMLAEAPGGGGDYVCTCGYDCEDSFEARGPGPLGRRWPTH